MVAVYRIFGLIIIALSASCQNEMPINSSLWSHYNSQSNIYEEFFIVENSEGGHVVFPVTADGIMPSKKMFRIKKNTYLLGKDENLTLSLIKDEALIDFHGDKRLFRMLYHIEDGQNYVYSQDSFFIRQFQASGDTSTFIYTNIKESR